MLSLLLSPLKKDKYAILFTILKIKAQSQNIKITNLMHKGMQVHRALNPKEQ